MRLAAGTKLDSYEILALLGTGGMGEVYRARDPQLKREVAIKVLPQFVSMDPDRLRRFEQEAQAAAALNHPNILAVYQFGSFEGAPYLVSELLDGATLRQQLAHGPLPVRKAIEYGSQIARGLAAAHEKRIVHRDLKPENLFVTRDGRVKILDFGLAKLTQALPASDPWGTTVNNGTDSGVLMGTVGYMSPEQVQGKPVDHRADIFALAAILYEMLTGKRAFEKPTSAETMTAILNEDPIAISQAAPSAPPGLQRVVHRCLEKNPDQRFQSASDLAFALEALSESGGSAAHVVDRGSRSRWPWIAVAAALVLLAVLLVAWWRIPPAVPVVASVTQITDDGQPKPGDLANDQSRLYFTEVVSGGKKLFQVSVTGGRTAPVETSVVNPSIAGLARDGSSLLALDPGGSLWSIPFPAGEPRLIAKGGIMNADLFPDGHIVYVKANDSKGTDFFAVNGDGSNLRKLLSIDASRVVGLWASPDGNQMLFNTYRRGLSSTVAVLSTLDVAGADGTDLHEILKDGELGGKNSFDWSPDGRYIVYLSKNGKQSEIWVLPIKRGLFQRKTEPIPLSTGPIDYTAKFTSRHGNQIFTIGAIKRGELVRYDIKSQQFVPFLSGISATDPTFSADGKWVAYASYPDQTLWRSRSDGSERRQLTFAPLKVNSPNISPDGSRVAFHDDDGTVFVISMEGGQAQRIGGKGGWASWSPDGNKLLFLRDNAAGLLSIADLRTGKLSVVLGTNDKVGSWWVSQDTLLAANLEAGKLNKLMIFDFKTQNWADLYAGSFMSWAVSQDRKYLYIVTAVADPKVLRLRFADRQVETIASLRDIHPVFANAENEGGNIDVAPDGSPIFTRDTGYQEIYALNVRWPR